MSEELKVSVLRRPTIDVNHRVYCGPKAISVLTGVPVSRVEKMLQRCRGGGYRDSRGRRMPVRDTYKAEVLLVLKRLGCKIVPLPFIACINNTIGSFLTDTSTLDKPCLVAVTNHWCVTFQGQCNDTRFRAARRVMQAWTIDAPSLPKYGAAEPVVKREKKPKPDIKLVRASRLAARIADWETKKRRAENALKSLRARMRRYAKLGVVPD